MSLNKLLFIFLMLLPQAAFLQTLSSVKKKADIAFENKSHLEALIYAEEVIQAEEENWQYYFQAGKSAYEARYYEKAVNYLTTLIENEAASEYPQTPLLLTRAFQHLGSVNTEYYQNAIDQAQAILSASNDPEEQTIAEEIVRNAQWAQQQLQECGFLQEQTTISAKNQLNTPGSDFPIVFTNNQLQYTTHSFAQKNRCNCKTDLCNAEMLWNRFNLNTNQLDSVNFPEPPKTLTHFTFSGSNHRVYYSICECNEEDEIICRLYYREQSGTGWGEPQLLPEESINLPNASVKQPYLIAHPDPEQDIDTLFYVSNRPGGAGGWDIWYCEIKNDRFGVSKNLSEVNTEGDEITPFFHSPTQTLFFSSNGRYPSFGGFDIYQWKINEYTEPENAGCPINSSFEDTYFIANASGDVNFLASNRGNGQNTGDDRYCCPDIFQIDGPPFIRTRDLLVKVVDHCNEEPLTVDYLTVMTENSGKSLSNGQKTQDGQYYFENVPLNDILVINAQKDGYYNADPVEVETSAPIQNERDTVFATLVLKPEIVLQVAVYNQMTENPFTSGATVRLADQSTGDTLVNNLAIGQYTCEFTLELDREYALQTYKETSDTVFVSTQEYQTVNTYNVTDFCNPLEERLSLFNPLPLYFDHAIPRPSGSTVANIDYGRAYQNYIKRAGTFRGKRINNGEEKAVDQFFAELEDAKSRLDLLAQTITNRISDYDSVNVVVTGFASSSGNPQSNFILSQRRTNSMEQYLQSIMPASVYNKLNITVQPFGSQTATDDESCQGLTGSALRECQRFSIPASLERRVEITKVEFIKN